LTKRLIKCDSLSVSYGARQVLSNISLTVDAGEIVSVIGPNGSGKTTLLKTIVGALEPTRGNIIRAPNLRIGYVPQRLHIDDTLPMTVRRFLTLATTLEVDDLSESLARVGAESLLQNQLMDLSGGQFQRVLLARALGNNPNLLLLDEATQGLDHRGAADFYRLLLSVKDQLQCGILLISHELHIVMRRADRVICINGKICCEGQPLVVTESPAYQALFGLEQDETALYMHNHSDSSATKAASDA